MPIKSNSRLSGPLRLQYSLNRLLGSQALVQNDGDTAILGLGIVLFMFLRYLVCRLGI